MLLTVGAAILSASCAGGAGHASVNRPTSASESGTQTQPPAPRPPSPRPPTPRPRQPSYPRLLRITLGSLPSRFVPVVSWRGQTAASIAGAHLGVALLSFNQRAVELRLHSGTIDAGGSGWRFGPEVAGAELRHLVAAFNGGFKFSTGAGGFMSFGRVAVPLRAGLGSIVTYTDGRTDIGSWHAEVPAPARTVASVRENLALLIDHGRPAASLDCVLCWGATLGGVSDPARSGLGITADGQLVWAGGEHLTPAQLADALLGAHVVRAVELDINPEWVAGYVYGHRGGAGRPAPVPVVPAQPGVPGFFLAPYGRDFFAVVAR